MIVCDYVQAGSLHHKGRDILEEAAFELFFGFAGGGGFAWGGAGGGFAEGGGDGFGGFYFAAGDFGVAFGVGHGEGDAAFFEVDPLDFGFDFVAFLDDVAGFVDAF